MTENDEKIKISHSAGLIPHTSRDVLRDYCEDLWEDLARPPHNPQQHVLCFTLLTRITLGEIWEEEEVGEVDGWVWGLVGDGGLGKGGGGKETPSVPGA